MKLVWCSMMNTCLCEHVFDDLALISNGLLEYLGMGGSHGVGKENLRRRFKSTRENGSGDEKVI
jgi:hypothetical protein